MGSFESLSAAEVLALAIDIEKKNAARYKKLARIFENRNNDLHVLFAELQDEELDHMDRLEALWERKFGKAPMPRLDSGALADVIEPVGPDPTSLPDLLALTPVQAIAFAHKAESSAYKFYAMAAIAATDPDLRALYAELASIEKSHIDQVTVDEGAVGGVN